MFLSSMFLGEIVPFLPLFSICLPLLPRENVYV